MPPHSATGLFLTHPDLFVKIDLRLNVLKSFIEDYTKVYQFISIFMNKRYVMLFVNKNNGKELI